jgi:hypothetical protein
VLRIMSIIYSIEEPGDWAESPEILMKALITAKVEHLTIWNVHIEG